VGENDRRCGGPKAADDLAQRRPRRRRQQGEPHNPTAMGVAPFVHRDGRGHPTFQIGGDEMGLGVGITASRGASESSSAPPAEDARRS